MTWFRCDDQLADHPKVMALGDLRRPALGLWTMCGTYCARYLTDGFVPRSVVAQYADRDLKRLTDALVAAGLFLVVTGGWRLHDYLDWNPSREQVLEERDRKAAAGKAGGIAAARARAKANARATVPPIVAEPAVPPSRPVPTSLTNVSDAHAMSEIEKAVHRLRNGSATEPMVDAFLSFAEQLGDVKVLQVAGHWEASPIRDRYGSAKRELEQLVKQRRSGKRQAVEPVTDYDALMVSDDDSPAPSAADAA